MSTWKIISLAALAWIWLWAAQLIGAAVDCKPVTADGVLVFVGLLVGAWWLGVKCGSTKP